MVPFSELAGLLVAALIMAMGILALAWSPWRSPWIARTAIWFGCYACLYSVRLAGDMGLIQAYGAATVWRYVVVFINYLILVPAGIFVDSLFGPGWKHSIRRMWQVTAVYALLAITWDLFSQRPGASMWLNRPVVLLAGSLLIAHLLLHWRKGKVTSEFRIAGTGGLIFLGVALYQTFGGSYRLEHYAMFLFIASVGYLVARRMMEGERRLVAVSKELEMARRIQSSILPRTLPKVPGLQLAAGYFPSSEIGGDFYDFQILEGSGLSLIVADVSGHGVPAALVASMVKIAFAAESEKLRQPGQALERINRTLCGKFTGAYITACCAYLDPASGFLRYACAGHPAPWILRGDGMLERLVASGLLLAFDPQAHYETCEVQVRADDRLVFFSDGLIEACDPKDAFFGESAFPQLMTESRSLSPTAFLDRTIASLQEWVGSSTHFQDDVTMVVVDIREA